MRRSSTKGLMILVWLACGAACSNQPQSQFKQHVDDDTGESYSHAIEPLRLVADQPALSRVGKDYLFVAPVSVSGAHTPNSYLWLAIGSSVDRRITGVPLPDVNAIVLVIDGMPMTFDLVPWSEIAASEPFEIGVEHYTSFSSRVTQSQLRRIVAATEISAYVTNGEDRSPAYYLVDGVYTAWADL